MPLEKKSDFFFTGVYNSDIIESRPLMRNIETICATSSSVADITRGIYFDVFPNTKKLQKVYGYTTSVSYKDVHVNGRPTNQTCCADSHATPP